MKWLVVYTNEVYGHLLKHPVTAETLKRWHGRGHIAELSEAGIDAAFEQHRIPPKRGRPHKQAMPECPKRIEIVHVTFEQVLHDVLVEAGMSEGGAFDAEPEW